MRQRQSHGILLVAIIAAHVAMIAPAAADTPLVYATIEPAQITLGQSAKYTITNLGNGTDSISLPVVSGLAFQVLGRTQQFEFVNGTMLASTSTVALRKSPAFSRYRGSRPRLRRSCCKSFPINLPPNRWVRIWPMRP